MWETFHRLKSIGILLDKHLKIYTIYSLVEYTLEYLMAVMESVQSQILRRMFLLNPRTQTKDVLLLARGKNGEIAPIECCIRQLQLLACDAERRVRHDQTNCAVCKVWSSKTFAEF
jgi:hypothetical protein